LGINEWFLISYQLTAQSPQQEGIITTATSTSYSQASFINPLGLQDVKRSLFLFKIFSYMNSK